MSNIALQRPPPRLPTADELPYEDGVPMETARHRAQMEVLIRGLEPWAAARGDVLVGGNQFVYFSAEQLRGRDFRGPDVYVVTGVRRGERKSWVVWEEGKAPDVVIELISETTGAFDKGEKRRVYQDQLRVPAYYWFDPFDPEDRAGFAMHDGRYRPVMRDADHCLPVPCLGLRLCLWQGQYLDITTTWLRWADADGLLPFPEELAAQEAGLERARADVEQLRADAEQARADAEQARADAAEHELARLRALLGEPPGAG